MGGSKPFGSGEDFPVRSPASGKPILVLDHDSPLAFTELVDTISSYTGHAGKFLVINSGENGVTVSTASTIVDALAALTIVVGGHTTILDANPIAFGVDMNMEQFETLGFRLEQIAGNPDTPVNGQLWYDTTAGYAKVYQDGAVQPFLTAANSALLTTLDGDVSTLQDETAANITAIENISLDSVLSRHEKPALKQTYDVIIAEQAGIDAQATQYGVTTEKTAYDDAITALTSYITGLDPEYDDYTDDTTIVRATFNSKFTDVYEAKQAVLDKINDNAYSQLSDAVSDTATALAAANTAESNSLIALADIADISSDGILSTFEKTDIILQEIIISTEQADIDAQADEFSVSRVAYDNAITALGVYLDTIDPDWDDNTKDSNITRTDFDTAWSTVYVQRQLLLNSIYAAAKALSDAAQSDATQALSDASDASIAAGLAQTAADNAQDDADISTGLLTDIAADNKLTGIEKLTLIREVADIYGDQILLDAQAALYSMTTELDDYDDAITALGVYLATISPDWDDNTQTSTIIRTTFNAAFRAVYDTKVILTNAIYEEARKAAIAEAQNAADSAHHARTKTVFDAGMISSGTFAVGDGIVVGNANAGMDGTVTGGSEDLDIRFWAGDTLANRATAPFRVQNDGTMHSTKAVIGGWTVDTDAIYFGTKHTGDGYAASAGDFTLAADGSIHAKNFYINVDGSVAFTAINSNIQTVPETGDTYTGSIKIAGNHIWEDSVNADTGGMYINKKGYSGGETKGRIVMFENGIGDPVMSVGYGSAPLPNVVAIWGKLYFGAGGVMDVTTMATSDPHVAGQVWNSSNTLVVSAG